MAGKCQATSVRRRVIEGVDDLIDRSAAATAHPRVLTPGPVRGVDLRVAFADVAIDVVLNAFPVATVGRTHPGLVGLLVAFDTPAWGHVNGEALGRGLVYACGPETEVAVGLPGGIRYATLAVQARSLATWPEWLGSGVGRSVRSDAWHDLVSVMSLLERRARADDTLALAPRETDAARRRLLDAVCSITTESKLAGAPGRARSISFAITRASEEFAQRHRFQGLSIGDLCDAVGVSERRLRYAFQDCYGLSPTAYLRGCALNEVRAALLSGHDQTVTQTATGLGFWHLGRFSSQYRALFGESPSDTLLRAEAGPASQVG